MQRSRHGIAEWSGKGEEDPFWGSNLFRERRETLAAVDDYNDDALASENLASIWGFNPNAVLASVWAVLDVFDDAAPLDQFWPGRFLVSPDDPQSGPHKRSAAGPDSGVGVQPEEQPVFSLDGMAGSWFPYGGDARMCPGRHFAKREIMATLALLAVGFDIEVTADRAAREMQWREFGLGT